MPDRPRFDEPPIPDDVIASQLDRGARADLKTLSKDNADAVARHLVMTSRLIDDDPALAHRHALAAAHRAGRVAVVRETVAITAYATGDFALALRELRTYRRLSGNNDQLALMVDSERGVGRPERALELGRSVRRDELEPAVQVGVAIAMSGARLDLGQPELALEELRIPQLDRTRAFPWSPPLFSAYAAVLDELGREEEAADWQRLADRAEAAIEAQSAESDTIDVVEEELPVDEEEPFVGEPSGSDGEGAVAEEFTVDSDADEPAAGEVGAGALAAGELDAVELSADELDADEFDADEVGADELDADHPSADEVGPDERDAGVPADDADADDVDSDADEEAGIVVGDADVIALDEPGVDEHADPDTGDPADDALFGDELFGDESPRDESTADESPDDEPGADAAR